VQFLQEPCPVVTRTSSYSIPSAEGGAHATRLSGQIVGQLGPGEQFVLWALRQRLRDGEAASPVLTHGFRLAFGLALLELALADFERLFRALHEHCRRDLGLFPLRCACVSADEQAMIALVAAAQAGEGPWLEALAARLVEPDATAALRDGTLPFALALCRAGLTLPPLPEAAAFPRTTLH
jgi:hypothetical protein